MNSRFQRRNSEMTMKMARVFMKKGVESGVFAFPEGCYFWRRLKTGGAASFHASAFATSMTASSSSRRGKVWLSRRRREFIRIAFSSGAMLR